MLLDGVGLPVYGVSLRVYGVADSCSGGADGAYNEEGAYQSGYPSCCVVANIVYSYFVSHVKNPWIKLLLIVYKAKALIMPIINAGEVLNEFNDV